MAADMKALRAAAQVEAWMLRAELGEPRPNWRDNADCLGCRRFTTDLCLTCPARLDCLRAAHQFEHANLEATFHIRGGFTEDERKGWYRLQTPRRAPARCGNPAGYRAHLRRGEDTCDACKAAHARANGDQRARRRRAA